MTYHTLKKDVDGNFTKVTIASPKNVLDLESFEKSFCGIVHGIIYNNACVKNDKKRKALEKQKANLTAGKVNELAEIIKKLSECDETDALLDDYLAEVDNINLDVFATARTDKFIFACAAAAVGLPTSTSCKSVRLRGSDDLLTVLKASKDLFINNGEAPKGIKTAINDFCNLWLKTDKNTLSESNGVTRRFTVDLSEGECRKLMFTVKDDIRWTKNGIVFNTSADKVINDFAIACLLYALKKEFKFETNAVKSSKVVGILG